MGQKQARKRQHKNIKDIKKAYLKSKRKVWLS